MGFIPEMWEEYGLGKLGQEDWGALEKGTFVALIRERGTKWD